MNTESVVQSLLESDEPAIRLKIRTGFLAEGPGSKSIRELRAEIRDSPRVAALLRRRGADGRNDERVYAKWQGGHWIMATLADIGYPTGDETLFPLRDQLQEHWQWPDGGWNCDKNPAACHSSFMESILPLRSLAYYGSLHDHAPAVAAARRAAGVFLKRHMFLSQADGSVIRGDFVELHYPLYWHYDVLHGLKVMAESGFVRDARCSPALDLLASKRLKDGGWPAEQKYYRASTDIRLGNDHVDWGGTSRKVSNPWVTADALHVLKAAGYLN